MGKKESWFSAIKRVFTHRSKEKSSNESEKKTSKAKRKGKGILKHGDTKSFIPIFKEPSSIEKILGEADEQRLFGRPPTSYEQAQPPVLSSSRPTAIASPRAASPVASSPRASSSRVASWRVTSPRAMSPGITSPRVASPKHSSVGLSHRRKEIAHVNRPEPSFGELNLSATKIQASFRGYMARRSFRALQGLVRLQGVVRGDHVKRQTMNAMKKMQLLVKVQTQIHSRRIQMLENQARQLHSHSEVDGAMSKWTLNQQDGEDGDWDHSLLTKEEVEARMRGKVEAMVKRERAMAYAYSHQLWKGDPKSALNVGLGTSPWWWNWLDRQLPALNPSDTLAAVKTIRLTPPRPMSERVRSSHLDTINHGYQYHRAKLDSHDESATPRSSKSTIPSKGKQFHTPSRTPPARFLKNPRSRSGSAYYHPFDVPLRDDDSLTSCPAFSVARSYMAPTISAAAKARASSNPRERGNGNGNGTPGNSSSRRFSFPMTPNSKASGNKDSASQSESERKPFNRFV